MKRKELRHRFMRVVLFSPLYSHADGGAEQGPAGDRRPGFAQRYHDH